MSKKKENNNEVQENEVIQSTEEEAAETAPADAFLESEEKYNELLNKYQRMAAEYDNYRKRSQKEKEALYISCAVDFAAKVLPVLDNLERAADADCSQGESYKKGVEMVLKQFIGVLKDMGLEETEALGTEFNPSLHNAVMHVEDDTIDTNTVIEQFAKGYTLKGEVVRHSMVKVAN